MADDPFLSRWSRLKKRSRTEPAAQPPLPPPAATVPGAATGTAPAPAEPLPLPDVATLTPESDFTPFMKPEVDPHLRRAALRTLFQDPRFNVMDGLDIYIADYSQPDPLPPEWLGQLNQMARLGEYREPEPEEPKGEAEGEAEGEAVAAKPAPEAVAGPPLEEPQSDTSIAITDPTKVAQSDAPMQGG